MNNIAKDKTKLQNDICKAIKEFESKHPGIVVTDIEYCNVFTGLLQGVPEYISYVIVEARIE